MASWEIWYYDVKSIMLEYASLNYKSSTPSSVYQCTNALLLNIASNCAVNLLNTSCTAVEFPMYVTDFFMFLSAFSQITPFMLFGIQSTKFEVFNPWEIFDSYNWRGSIFPLKMAKPLRYLPCRGSAPHNIFLAASICFIKP